MVQGGRERGLILHELMEEVLTGEADAVAPALTERADVLIRALGRSPIADPATGLSAAELAGCVMRTLALPEIAELRPALLAEFPVYAARADDGEEMATAGMDIRSLSAQCLFAKLVAVLLATLVCMSSMRPSDRLGADRLSGEAAGMSQLKSGTPYA